jgi:hypothetical protein
MKREKCRGTYAGMAAGMFVAAGTHWVGVHEPWAFVLVGVVMILAAGGAKECGQ